MAHNDFFIPGAATKGYVKKYVEEEISRLPQEKVEGLGVEEIDALLGLGEDLDHSTTEL